jgi:uncharacterized membrane protein YfcA
MELSTIAMLVLIGTCAGLLSGFVGVGGGLIIIPLLVMMGLSQHVAQGTSLAIMLPPIGILAALNYHKAGYVEWKYAMIVAAAFILGGYFSSKWAVNLDPRMLKKIFGIIMLLGGVKLVFSK